MASTFTRSAPAPVVARRERRLQLGKRPRRGLLIAHVLSSVGWFGAAGMVLFLLVLAQGSSEVTFAHSLYRAVETSLWLTLPLAAVSALTGFVLGFGTPWGVAKHWWVVIKEVALIPLVVTDLLVVAPSVHDAARGTSTGRPLDAAIAHCVVLALATIVSVVKPFGRTPRGRRGVPSRG
jgi:hypothetical protein